MNLLAIETSTEACSVAVLSGGEVVERFELAPRRHAELVLPWCGRVLAEAGVARSQLDAVAVGRGPGAFTGVRLGIAVAQGLALGLDRPLLPVSTLAVLAMEATRLVPDPAPIRVLATLDARMQEVYAGSFELRDGDALPLDTETVGAPAAVDLPTATGGDADEGPGWVAVGSGLAALDGALATRFAGRLRATDPAALPRAGRLARLAARAWARGEAVAPHDVEPAYLRNQVALTIGEQQALRGARTP